MTSIGIVGAGIAGLHLALRLQQFGVHTTVHTDHTGAEIRASRPRNFPARFGQTQAREDLLGVHHWRFPDAQTHTWHVTLHGASTLGFRADLNPPSSVVDFRLYLPQLMADYADRGGHIVFGTASIDRLARDHDLVVVANGSPSMKRLFPRDADRSPYSAPPRILCTGLYRGIGEATPHSMDIHFLPGVGEILRLPFFSLDGRVDVLAVEAVPGGPLEPLCHMDATADPAAFHRAVLELLATHAPSLRERVDLREFALTAPGGLAQGGITPVVRHNWADLGEGTFALAIGDAWIVNDPLSAQGTGLASLTAFTLADAIASTLPPYDEMFCRAMSKQLWDGVSDAVNWSNAFLAPPPPHVLRLLAEAAGDKRVADAFVNNFNDPAAMWRAVSSPWGAESFLTETAGKGP
ncbi:monooxygenase [Allokutzneria sp. A3M-2-11 16]|uniref:styrene monooxygenase/indole monooxygenase family protein n=1 Tax=Allokutzneria sp. A3M-2-11 16 TaxID=2962043 RepID=UPI0020B729AA|nr:styrene monooxygenase/indole monooxygenase family protein [Allokutzneria sp. A3M-2-11 16]MCP3804857.1 monooxygenase [Allokutzneria sp. A3M-2-11 16]